MNVCAVGCGMSMICMRWLSGVVHKCTVWGLWPPRWELPFLGHTSSTVPKQEWSNCGSPDQAQWPHREHQWPAGERCGLPQLLQGYERDPGLQQCVQDWGNLQQQRRWVQPHQLQSEHACGQRQWGLGVPRLLIGDSGGGSRSPFVFWSVVHVSPEVDMKLQ